MKRIIDGKIYDTETAEELGFDSYSNPGDFQYWEEGLFKTKKGAFFLAGSGGAMSKYAESRGNGSTGGGSHIMLITKEEAFDWLQEVDMETAIELFPDKVVEG